MTTIAGRTPVLVDGFTGTRTSRTVVHTLLNSGDPAISIRPAGLRTGTLSALFETQAQAQALADALATGAVQRYTDSDAGGSFRFVPSGRIEVRLDDSTRAAWWVTFDYSEVA